MDAEKLARLKEIRREHYPLMVSNIVDWLQLHGDPQVVEEAIREACQLEVERLKFEREYKAQKQGGAA
jgi:hypothetical protein